MGEVLNYKTPSEVFFGKIAQWIDESLLYYKKTTVALEC
jgi:hypothetical protein